MAKLVLERLDLNPIILPHSPLCRPKVWNCIWIFQFSNLYPRVEEGTFGVEEYASGHELSSTGRFLVSGATGGTLFVIVDGRDSTNGSESARVISQLVDSTAIEEYGEGSYVGACFESATSENLETLGVTGTTVSTIILDPGYNYAGYVTTR